MRPQGKGVYEECALGLEFMVVKPHPVAMIQAPKWGILAKNKHDTGRDTGWQGKDGWVGLAEYQEGRKRVGLTLLKQGRKQHKDWCKQQPF